MCIGRNLLFQSSTVHSASSTCKPFVSRKKTKRKTNPTSTSNLPPTTYSFPEKNRTKNESDPQPPAHSFPEKKIKRKTNPIPSLLPIRFLEKN